MAAIVITTVVGDSVDDIFEGMVVVCIFWGVDDGLDEVFGVREGDTEVLVWGVGLVEGLIVGVAVGDGDEDGVRSEVGLKAKALDSAVKL